MVRSIQKPITLGVIVGSRQFFNGAPALVSRSEVIAQLDALGVGHLMLPAEATENGAVQSRDDARLYARFFREHRDDIDGLVILLSNFSDEIAISELISMAQLDVPALVVAGEDDGVVDPAGVFDVADDAEKDQRKKSDHRRGR